MTQSKDIAGVTSKDIARDAVGEYQWGFHDDEKPLFIAEKGLNEDVIRSMSGMKNEPAWMLEYRLDAYRQFLEIPNPKWAGSPELLEAIDFDDIHYYVKATDQGRHELGRRPRVHQGHLRQARHPRGRAPVPRRRRRAVRLRGRLPQHPGGPREAGRRVPRGWTQGLEEYPEIVQEYFGTVIPSGDNKYAALNSAVWSGGSFIYVPPGVHVDVPLQAYFRINTENMGQFERTLIVADEGSYVHYVEGCTAPIYSSSSLHSAVVEIVVKKGARVRYSTIQNWSNNVYNLVTKRAVAHEDAVMEWVDGNLGSKLTMKYPSVYLMGERAHGEILSLAFAGDGQHQTRAARSSTSHPTRPRRSSRSRCPAVRAAAPTAVCSRSTTGL